MANGFTRLSPAEVQAKIESGCECKIVDVRTPNEYEQYHIPGAIPIPLQEFAARYEDELRPEDEIICICEHGVRSAAAAQYLLGQGYTNIADMEGGMARWTGPTEP